MSDIDDIFGSDSSSDELDPKQPTEEPTETLAGSPAEGEGEGGGEGEGEGEGTGDGEGAGSGGGDDDGFDDDPFKEDDDPAGSAEKKTLRRLSKGKGKVAKKRRREGEPWSEEKSKSKKLGKGKRKKGDKEGGKRKKKKKKKKKDKQALKAAEGSDPGNASDDSFGAAEQDSDEEVEADLEPEEKEDLSDGGGMERGPRNQDDDNFIDDTDDHADLLAEYKGDPPLPGSDSEAEEDNKRQYRDETSMAESPMTAVLLSMKRRKAQELSTAERESIAQEFLFKINKAAEDDEEAVSAGKPALNKLKMLKVVKATLAKKELQETFLEFDLLGVVKRWLQPYSNGQLPNLTVRKEMLALVLMLPVQVDHLKRSGIGRVVMGLLNSREETLENKRVLKELVHRWNRPIFAKGTDYRAMRAIQDEPEAIEASAPGSRNTGMRRMQAPLPQREGPRRDESVGNILDARAKGVDPTKARVPFSNGYAFAKAPKSRVEVHGRGTTQPAETTSRTKLLKKMTALSRPVSKG